MDGRVGALRAALDEHGLSETPIIAYSAKFASAFYGPFREAADSAPAAGRPPRLPDGSRQRARGRARGAARRGEGADVVMVKPALPYLDVIRRVRERTALPVAAYNVSGEYAMIKAAAAHGPDRRARRRARGPDRHPPRRRRHRHHLPRQGRRHDGSSSPAEGALAARTARAIPLDETDKQLLNLMQGRFALARAPVRRTSRSSPALTEDEVMQRVQRLLDGRIIREITPIFDTRALGYSSMLVAAKVDAEYPHRAAKFINTHPGVTHNYLRNHDFNLWFTIATEPGSKLGLTGTLDIIEAQDRRPVDPPAADAEAVQDPHGPRDGEGHRRAAGRRRGRRAARARPDRAVRGGRRDDPRHPGPDAGRRRALRARRRAARRPQDEVLARLESLRERGGLRRVAAILFHRRAGFSANGMGVWEVPEEQILDIGPADGRVPRHLALLPAPDLRRLAVLGLHDGPRPLQGGVRRDPRLDRRADRASTERATLYSSTEFKKVRMLYFTDDFRAGSGERRARIRVRLADRHPLRRALPPRASASSRAA